jgi:hypothetical protein
MTRIAALLIVLAVLAGCAGRSDLTPPGAAPMAAHKVKATIQIHIPKAAKHVRVRVVRKGRPRYVSAATEGMTLAIAGPTHLNETVGLTPTSTGCASSATDTTCTLTLTLAPCASGKCYTATISTFDAVSCTPACTIPGGANELSTAQNVAFGVTAGQSNAISLTLAGVPVQLALIPNSIFTTMSANGALGTTDVDLIGLGAHPFIVQALDAGGNVIVGPGSPAYSVAQTGGSLSVTIAAPGSTNGFAITSPAAFSSNTATLAVQASYAGQAADGCTQPSANCTLHVTAHMLQMLAVASQTGGCCSTGVVTLYALGDSQPFVSLENDVDLPDAIAADPSGNVYVGNSDGVIELPAGSTVVSGSFNLNPTGSGVASLTTDASGNLFAGVHLGGSSAVDEFTPGVSAPSRVIASGVDQPGALATDANGRLYVLNSVPGTVTEYDPASTTAIVTVAGFGGPTDLAVASGSTPDLYVADLLGEALWRFPYGSNVSDGDLSTSQGAPNPISVALDGAGNVYAGNETANTVAKWPATGTWPVAASATYTTGIDGPEQLAVDANGNLVVENLFLGPSALAPIEIFPAGTTVPSLQLTSGITIPATFVIVP